MMGVGAGVVMSGRGKLCKLLCTPTSAPAPHKTPPRSTGCKAIVQGRRVDPSLGDENMAGNLPPHGEILRLSEIHDRGPLLMAGKSVRVMGKLTQYDAIKQLAVITASERNSTHHLQVNTRLIEPFQSRIGSMFQFIGEMPSEMKSDADMVVHSRVVRCVDGIDSTMYYNACDVQRKFQASRGSSSASVST